MPKLTLTKIEAQNIVFHDHDRAKVVLDTIEDTSRWSIRHRLIFELDGTLWEGRYQVGATEMQDESPFEYTDPEFFQVEPYEKTIVEYRKVGEQ